MELATGQVTELATTYAAQLTDTGQPCGDLCGSGTNDPPHWSPDGTRLVFARQGIGPVDRPAGDGNGQPGDTIFTVNADGTDLRQLVPMELFAIEPRWSPDGSLITFISATPTGSDVHVVRPDGTGLRRMTTDGASIRPSWTSNGRLVFLRYPGGLTDPAGFEVWIMDADGQNSSELDPTNLAELTAAQCRSCPYLAQPETGFPDTAVWQPPR
jgi:Tol biopolymer transport system component